MFYYFVVKQPHSASLSIQVVVLGQGKRFFFDIFFGTVLFYFYADTFFPQQRQLMGSSAQISSGVCRCGSQEQVPEEGSGRFRRVPACVGAGVGSGGGFRKVPESSDVKQCKFRRVPAYAGVGSGGKFRKVPKGWFRKVSEGSGGFWRVPARVGVGSGGRVRKVPKSSGTCWCRFRRQSSGVVCCLATLTGAAM